MGAQPGGPHTPHGIGTSRRVEAALCRVSGPIGAWRTRGQPDFGYVLTVCANPSVSPRYVHPSSRSAFADVP